MSDKKPLANEREFPGHAKMKVYFHHRDMPSNHEDFEKWLWVSDDGVLFRKALLRNLEGGYWCLVDGANAEK